MQVSQCNTANLYSSKKVSFNGLTKALKKRVFSNHISYFGLKHFSHQEYIGSLPREIIQDIKKIAKNPQEKKAIIKNIMDGFTQVAKVFHKCQEKYFRASCGRYLRYEDKYVEEVIAPACVSASKEITKVFQDVGLLKKSFFGRNKITLKYLGHGAYGEGIMINFPTKCGYKSKVMKVFYPQKYNTRRSHHGLFPEINAAFYISNINGQKVSKRPFVDFYFASKNADFMVSEYARNYDYLPKNDLVLASLVNCQDTHANNVVNGRIIDYGAIKTVINNTSRSGVKIYKKLAKLYVKAHMTNNFDEFKKVYEDLVQKTSNSTDASVYDLKKGFVLFNRLRNNLDKIIEKSRYSS